MSSTGGGSLERRPDELELAAVRRVYRGFELGPLSFRSPVGVTALLGANGAGKSTLMRVISGVESPDEGVVHLPGADIRSVGYLPQDFTGPRQVSAGDYLRFVAWCRSTRRRRITEGDVAEALSAVGLEAKAASRIGTLSGGMVRRLGIAQALLGGGSLLVLDEPTVGLDPVQREEVRELIGRLGRDRVVLLSTHLADDVAAVAARVLVLDGGDVLLNGTVGDLAAAAAGTTISAESVGAGFLELVRRVETADVA